MSINKMINGLLKPFGCRVIRLGTKEGQTFDPLERNDVKTLEALWGDPEFRSQYLSPERKQLYRVVFEQLKKLDIYGPTCNLLDVGCGPGFFPRLIKDEGFAGPIFGCDFSAQAVSLSSTLIPDGKFFQHDIYEPMPAKYDLIVCMETLEHLLDPDRALLNLVGAASVVVLTVPEGRKDSFRGHLNFWSKDSFNSFLKRVLPQKEISVAEVSNERNLLAIIT